MAATPRMTRLPLRPCGTCSQPYPNGQCPRHPPASRQYRPHRKSVTAGTYSRDWQTNIRTAALERDAHECVYCGAHATTVDHIWPASRGGPSTLNNAAAACPSCNNSKKDSTVEEWIRSGRAPAAAAARVLGNPRFTRTVRTN